MTSRLPPVHVMHPIIRGARCIRLGEHGNSGEVHRSERGGGRARGGSGRARREAEKGRGGELAGGRSRSTGARLSEASR